jgi:hypothetical protein
MAYGLLDNGVVIAEFVVPLTLRTNKPVFANDSASLKRNVMKRSSQRWELEARFDPKRTGAHIVMTHMIVKGNTDVFQIIVPQNQGAKQAKTSTSTPTCTGSLGATQVTVANNVGIIPTGTFIRFSNHSKIYMTTTTLTGTGPLGIYPQLRIPQNATTFTFQDDVIMDCLYDTDTVQGMVYEDAILMDNGVVKIIENV